MHTHWNWEKQKHYWQVNHFPSSPQEGTISKGKILPRVKAECEVGGRPGWRVNDSIGCYTGTSAFLSRSKWVAGVTLAQKNLLQKGIFHRQLKSVTRAVLWQEEEMLLKFSVWILWIQLECEFDKFPITLTEKARENKRKKGREWGKEEGDRSKEKSY